MICITLIHVYDILCILINIKQTIIVGLFNVAFKHEYDHFTIVCPPNRISVSTSIIFFIPKATDGFITRTWDKFKQELFY